MGHVERHSGILTGKIIFLLIPYINNCLSVKECEKKHQGIKKLKPSQLIPWRNREAKFVCDTCGYRTKGKAALDRHINGKHNSEKTSNARSVEKTLNQKQTLTTIVLCMTK